MAALVPLLLLVLMAGGCTIERMVHDDSAADALGALDDELDFWDEVATRHSVTNNDALHGLLLLAGVSEENETENDDISFSRRLRLARERGWIAEDRELPPNETATVGLMAMAVCEILEIPGGLSARVFGPSPRSCTRELIHRRMIPPRTDNQALSGLEFIDLVGRSEDHLGFRAAQQ
ncbi:MAG: hypothetical protein GY715_05325 [Planctomycetes bacterium]|nr:hypothetical protein [Planctomycetota bacterium]